MSEVEKFINFEKGKVLVETKNEFERYYFILFCLLQGYRFFGNNPLYQFKKESKKLYFYMYNASSKKYKGFIGGKKSYKGRKIVEKFKNIFTNMEKEKKSFKELDEIKKLSNIILLMGRGNKRGKNE